MTIVATSKFLEFKSAKSPSGHDWFYTRRTNDTNKHDSGVVITTLVKKDGEYNFLFIKTKRPPMYAENKAELCIESPAGLIGDINQSETLEECAKKELLEETGLEAIHIYKELENSSTSAGLSSETLTYVTAIVENLSIKEQPVSDGGIIVERFFVPAKQIKEYFAKVNQKEFAIAAPTVCGVFFALQRI